MVDQRGGGGREGDRREHAFTAEDVDAAIEYVTRNGAENSGATVYYTLVFDAAGLPAPQLLHQGGESQLVTDFMAAFHWRCIERGLPPLDSLVVHVAGRRERFPGKGYFGVNGRQDPLDQKTDPVAMAEATTFWERQKEECRQWGVRSRRGLT